MGGAQYRTRKEGFLMASLPLPDIHSHFHYHSHSLSCLKEKQSAKCLPVSPDATM